MAQFPKIQLTRQGKNLVIAGQNKQKILFTKVELGDGVLNGQSIESMTALVHRVMALPLQDFLNKGDGGARLRFVLDNNNLSAGFFNREIGVFAKVEGGNEQLYAYTNAGNLADYIPGKESPIASKIIDLHIVVGNAANITIVAENSAYATKLDLNAHRGKTVIDHPDRSVTTQKLADGSVTTEKIVPKAITKEKIAFDVYNVAEINQKLDGKVNKSGDTMTGELTAPSFNLANGFLKNGTVDVPDAIDSGKGGNINLASWQSIGIYDKCNSRYTGSLNTRTGDWRTFGKITAGNGFYGNLSGTAAKAANLTVGGQIEPLTGREDADIVKVHRVYSDQYPSTFGNIITIGGDGGSQLLLGWTNVVNGIGPVYYRCRRDVVDTWGPWQKIIFASDLSQALNGKANISHGNHVPATEPANNTRFLRNDNTWQPVTPGNIGAYTRSEVDGKLGSKAPLVSPALTGTPTVPTAPQGTNSGQIASTAFVAQAIASLVNSAPAALDTLQELAKALGNDANFATTITNALSGKLGKAETAVNANGLGGKSLQWILDQISAAKTGIIASSLAQNGWVKFAGGFILQWGVSSANEADAIVFPISFNQLFSVTMAKHTTAGTQLAQSRHFGVNAYSNKGVTFTNEAQYSPRTFWIAVGI
nr:MAG TPA: Baseplate wedge protein [Caudoviricetes sp.]